VYVLYVCVCACASRRFDLKEKPVFESSSSGPSAFHVIVTYRHNFTALRVNWLAAAEPVTTTGGRQKFINRPIVNASSVAVPFFSSPRFGIPVRSVGQLDRGRPCRAVTIENLPKAFRSGRDAIFSGTGVSLAAKRYRIKIKHGRRVVGTRLYVFRRTRLFYYVRPPGKRFGTSAG